MLRIFICALLFSSLGSYASDSPLFVTEDNFKLPYQNLTLIQESRTIDGFNMDERRELYARDWGKDVVAYHYSDGNLQAISRMQLDGNKITSTTYFPGQQHYLVSEMDSSKLFRESEAQLKANYSAKELQIVKQRHKPYSQAKEVIETDEAREGFIVPDYMMHGVKCDLLLDPELNVYGCELSDHMASIEFDSTFEVKQVDLENPVAAEKFQLPIAGLRKMVDTSMGEMIAGLGQINALAIAEMHQEVEEMLDDQRYHALLAKGQQIAERNRKLADSYFAHAASNPQTANEESEYGYESDTVLDPADPAIAEHEAEEDDQDLEKVVDTLEKGVELLSDWL